MTRFILNETPVKDVLQFNTEKKLFLFIYQKLEEVFLKINLN